MRNPGFLVSSILLLAFGLANAAIAQTDPVEQPLGLVNGGVEERTDDGLPAGWMFGQQLLDAGYRLELDEVDPVEGKLSARVDSTDVESEAGKFGNLSQSFDATPWRGKRIRFRAAVKTADRSENSKAQLWFRVDRKSTSGQPRMGFFDNMGERPIVEDTWQHYEIVGDIDDDADRIILGMLVLGKCVAWIDDASLKVVEKTVQATGSSGVGPGRDPPQPFFVWWLILPAAGLALFWLGSSGNRWFNRLAFRFSVAYWLLYCFPTLLQTALGIFIPAQVAQWTDWYHSVFVDGVVRWTAANVLGIEGQLVSAFQNGSGDTTFSYVQALVCFVLAIAVAGLWMLVDWRKTDHAWLKDLLRSYLRFVLAVTMLGYGLAKLGLLFSQFPVPGAGQLARSYGESSPMGLLWTFMGASPAYTFFAGAGETLAALLLVWRRTALLGGLVAFGVMLNVMMLNFCYDVPVKLYSFHLVVMALFICLPDYSRLANVLIWHRAVEPVSQLPPYTGDVTIWFQRVIKAYLIVIAIGIPLYIHLVVEWKSAGPYRVLGEWTVSEVLVDGQPDSGAMADALKGGILTLSRTFPAAKDRSQIAASVVLRFKDRPAKTGMAVIHSGKLVFQFGDLPEPLSGEPGLKMEDGRLELSVAAEGKEIRVRLERAANENLLMNRGFRWINERPYNR